MIEPTLAPEQDPALHETIVAEGVSFEAFLKFFAEHHAEWLVGKVILVRGKASAHQSLLLFLMTMLNLYLGLKSLGEILSAGFPMKIADDVPAREPDLLIVLNAHRERIKANYLDGPADIVVEIVSPESVTRDRGIKFIEYEQAGVREYWLFDPLRTEAVIYALGDDQRYHPVPLDKDGRLVSSLLSGFALHPTLLWRDELPTGIELITLAQQMASAPDNTNA
jgi:Uma2 family endonuclease